MNYTLTDYTVAPAPTFGLPPDNERKAIVPGQFVKVVFNFQGEMSERMWVKVTDYREGKGSGKFIGSLDNNPLSGIINRNDLVEFDWNHVICIL